MAGPPPNELITSDLGIQDELVLDLADRFGTPLYIYDADLIRRRWRSLLSILPSRAELCYSVKANPNLAILRILVELGASFEIASGGELALALAAGAQPEKVVFVGPGKTEHEIAQAVDVGVGVLVVEAEDELIRIGAAASRVNKTIDVALRLNLGRGGGDLSMGGSTQFGMSMETARAILSGGFPRKLSIIGVHSYFGTGILDTRLIEKQTKEILTAADELESIIGYEFKFLDLGGGFGIPYFQDDEHPDWGKIQRSIDTKVTRYCDRRQNRVRICFESGRYIVGESGIFVATVLSVKQNFGRRFVVLDGGTGVFRGWDRYLGARVSPLRILGCGNGETQVVTFCGPLCTSLDRLAADVEVVVPRVGARVCFYNAGAYGMTAAPGLFLSQGYPAEVLIDNGEVNLVSKQWGTLDVLTRYRD